MASLLAEAEGKFVLKNGLLVFTSAFLLYSTPLELFDSFLYIFPESALRKIESINRDFRLTDICMYVCALREAFYWRGMETSSQRGSFLNCLNEI